MPATPPLASTLPDLAHAGSRNGVAAAYAYATIREKLFPNEPRIALKVKERYTLLAKLGEGMNGVVFAAYDPELNRKVALKVLRTPGDSTSATRLLREAQSLALINHPHVVQVHDAGEYRGEVFLTMEFVEGESLDAWIERVKPGLAQLLDTLIAVGRGLAAAHAKGIVHRDIKPANILVGADGRARVADFGIARTDQLDVSSRTDLHADASMAGTVPSTLTHSAGTPAYMSPEQCERKAVDARSDVFSFCIVAWEAVFGVRPFVADTAAALLLKIVEGKISPVIRPRGVPAKLEQVLRRGLATAPGDRYSAMEPLLAELEAIRRPRAPRRWLLGIGGVAAGLTLAVITNHAVAGSCVRAAGEVAEIWSESRAVAIREAFAATGEAFAPAVADKMVARLDAFAAELKGATTANCEAHDDGSLSESQYHRGQQCLEDRRLALASTAAALAEPTPGLLAVGLDEVSRSLGDVALCRDETYLAATVAAPDTGVSDAVAAVEDLRRAGDRQLLRGEFLAAAETFERAVEQARAAGYAPTTSRALYDLGRTYQRLRRSDQAEPLFREARSLADGASDDYAAADASFLLLSNAIDRGALDDAMPLYEETLAKLERTRRARGGPRGELELVRAALLLSEDQPEAAKQALEQAEAELADPTSTPGMVQVYRWRTRAVLARLKGDQHEVITAIDQARMALMEQVGTEDHPIFAVTFVLEEIAGGRLEAAASSLARARRIYERAFGTNSVMMVELLLASARLDEARGNDEKVFEAVQRADEILQAQRVDSMLLKDYADVASRLGNALRERGRSEEALAAYGRGLAALSAIRVPAYDSTFAVISASRADLLRRQAEKQPGDPTRLERAAADVEAALSRFSLERGGTASAIAGYVLRVAVDVAFARGDLVETRRRAEEALALLAKYPEPETQARVAYTLARALGPSESRAQELAAGTIAYFTGAGRLEDAAEVRNWAAGLAK